jgi:hypothetical protein
VRWWGSFDAAILDVNENFLEISSNVLCGNAKCLHAVLARPSVAALVSSWIVAENVRKSVDFDSKRGSLAEEVEHEWSERMLAAELKAIWAQAKYPPESYLGRAHSFA